MTEFILPNVRYVVSFNCKIGGVSVGQPLLRTLDWGGNSIKQTVEFVLDIRRKEGRELAYVSSMFDNGCIGFFYDVLKGGNPTEPPRAILATMRLFLADPMQLPGLPVQVVREAPRLDPSQIRHIP
jgi:hypothetical protein